MPSGPPRILVVDDSPLVLSVLRRSLEDRSMTVDTASTLEELEQRRAEAAPDVIVLDVHMPEAWGDDVASTLRGAYGVSVPILLMSTMGADELAPRAAAAGATAWISKQDGWKAVTERILELVSAGSR